MSSLGLLFSVVLPLIMKEKYKPRIMNVVLQTCLCNTLFSWQESFEQLMIDRLITATLPVSSYYDVNQIQNVCLHLDLLLQFMIFWDINTRTAGQKNDARLRRLLERGKNRRYYMFANIIFYITVFDCTVWYFQNREYLI